MIQFNQCKKYTYKNNFNGNKQIISNIQIRQYTLDLHVWKQIKYVYVNLINFFLSN
jgi:hypothetical protein